MNKTQVILSYLTDSPITVRELQKLTGISPRLISGTINRIRTRGGLVYIAGWTRQQTEIRWQWVAKWHYGLPPEADKKMPRPMSDAELYRNMMARRRRKTRASSVFAWCSS